MLRRRGGLRSAHPLLVVHASCPPGRTELPSRVGFVVSKAVGGAVVRNRTKRRLRHLCADRLTALGPGIDVVVRANPAAAAATSAELGLALDDLMARLLRGSRR